MAQVDERLLDPNGEPEIAENFNRLIQIIDEGSGTPGPQGPAGKDGKGIKSITGSIDGSNKLTLTFTLTDDSTQTVEGTITPPTL